MSYRAWEPNAIGSIVPPFAGGSGGGGGGGNNDRFAPKYLVGNTPAGDTAATTGTAAGFSYIADPGDGSGIEAALAACAAAGGGDVWIRPGTYDLALGAVVAPLVIPPNTRVQGAGPSTVTRGRSVGDQGVWRIDGGGPDTAFSSLRDLSVVVPTDTGPTVGSLGAILVVGGGGSVLNGLQVEVQSANAADPALYVGILFNTAGTSPVPQTSLESCAIQNARSVLDGPNGKRSACIRIAEGQIAARNVTTVGADVGVDLDNRSSAEDSGGCLFFGSQVFVLQPFQYGFATRQADDATNVAAVRVSDSILVAPDTVPPPLGAGTRAGIYFEASLVSTFRSTVVLGFDTGFVTEHFGGPRNLSIQIDDCAILRCTQGVRFGNHTRDSSVSDTEIGTSLGVPISVYRGVEVQGGLGFNPEGISIANNTIHVGDYLGTGGQTYCVLVQNAAAVFIEGNECLHQDTQNAAADWTIRAIDSQNLTIADNVLTSTAEEAAVYVTQSDPTASRVTILGNVLRLPAPARPKYGVWAQAQGVTITGNSIDQRALILAGAAIRLEPIGQDLATRCTVVGNAIEPSTAGAGPAILIESDENACSTNACSLAAPPATAAIQISGNNNTCVANVCRTAPAVLNTGAGNEVAHNI